MPSELGSLVAAFRRAKKLSLRELTERIDASPGFGSMMENEGPAPPVREGMLRVPARKLSLLLGLVGKVQADFRKITPSRHAFVPGALTERHGS